MFINVLLRGKLMNKKPPTKEEDVDIEDSDDESD